MDTHSDSTITPSAHLQAVEALLKKLDGESSIKQRLESLMKKGPEVVPGFDFNDAFSQDAERSRVEDLAELQKSTSSLKATWHDAPLAEEVKTAAARLFEHLLEFVRDAGRQEKKLEIKTLSSLWRSEPDVSGAFGLPTPSYYPEKKAEPYPPKEAFDTLSETEAEGFTKARKADSALDVLGCDVEELEDKAATIHDTFVDGVGNGLPLHDIEKEKRKLDASGVQVPVHIDLRGKMAAVLDDREASSPGERVVDVLRSSAKEFSVPVKKSAPRTPAPKEVLEDEVDMLDIRSWTLAINEVLASNWTFGRQLRGRIGDRARMGITLIWTKGDSEMRLDLERLATDEHLVRLVPPRSKTDQWQVETSGLYQLYAKEMTSSQLAELHKDPSEFVKKILR